MIKDVTIQSMGGKARWKGVSKKERSRLNRKAILVRWNKRKKNGSKTNVQ